MKKELSNCNKKMNKRNIRNEPKIKQRYLKNKNA